MQKLRELKEKYSKPEEVFQDESYIEKMTPAQREKTKELSKVMYSKIKDAFTKNRYAYYEIPKKLKHMHYSLLKSMEIANSKN
eukprot:CAMPEP_0168351194 /NCGR_PEP_ID=MMETSP0213-20121227/21674_1 /TAXON_ID=151035 /ORGANISM="Euplotes harpa, Strain FSP1.4" /LENGTH=82 /DNA_ID=CAMNT_0008361895 /DNA_START=444 /DNA_END=689 /DNA_ORIENTATION=-